jgi:cadmium resistance protein CadD (predicted permease)
VSQLTDVGVAIVVFAATNLDDLFVIIAFLAAPVMRARAVVAGQFLGIAILVLASVAAARFAIAVPHAWIAWLGLVPLLLGLNALRGLRGAWKGTAAAGGGEESSRILAREARAERRLHSQVLAVAGVTIANGGDNLGAYIPLFATAFDRVALYAVVFAVMTGVWCLLGHALVRSPVAGTGVRRAGHVLLPFVLIALGFHILSRP